MPSKNANRIESVIVISGTPGSGKTTLARQLAIALELPLISKDVIKEALYDTLGTGDLELSRRFGAASHRIMYALARDTGPCLLEAFFRRGIAEADLHSLGSSLVQVHCSCPIDIAVARYRLRVDDADRHGGHLPEHQSDSAIASWAKSEPGPLHLDGPLIVADTSGPVDISELAKRIRAVA